MATVWFEDPLQLFEKDSILKFWPTGSQTSAERVNSTTRFVIYASCILYVLNRDVRVFLLAGVLLASLYVMWISNMIPNDFRLPTGPGSCTDPTLDNPMGNIIPGDRPDKPGPCWYPDVRQKVHKQFDTIFPHYQNRSAQRNWYSAPVNDVEPLKQALNPDLYNPNCRESQGACYDFRYPEDGQRRTLSRGGGA